MLKNKTFALGFACATLLGFSQCKSKGSSTKVNMSKPESVSLAFIRAFAQLDIEKAKTLATPESMELLGAMEQMAAMMPEEERQAAKTKSAAEMDKLQSSTCKIKGDEADCIVCCSPEGKSAEEPIKLKRVDKKWLVHMTKDQMGGDVDQVDPMPPMPEED
jgi:hypothetical protein